MWNNRRRPRPKGRLTGYLALQGLHGFLAVHGFLAAHGLHGLRLIAQRLQAFALQGEQAAICTSALAEMLDVATGNAVVAAARAATLSMVTVFFNHGIQPS